MIFSYYYIIAYYAIMLILLHIIIFYSFIDDIIYIRYYSHITPYYDDLMPLLLLSFSFVPIAQIAHYDYSWREHAAIMIIAMILLRYLLLIGAVIDDKIFHCFAGALLRDITYY